MKYGRALRIVRAAKGLSQKDVAERADLNPSYLSLLEREARSPSVNAISALSAALGIPPHLLALLASEDSELIGIREESAEVLGKQLLDLLLAAQA